MNKKKYKFESCSEVVQFTPVEQLFNKKQLQKIAKLNIRPHQCHYNSVLMSLHFNCGYCDGIFCGCLDHAFNYIIKGGRTYYFDITAYMQNKEDKSGITTVVLRRYAANDILQLIDDLQVAFVTTSVTYTEKFGNITISDSGEIINVNTSEDSFELTKKNIDLYSKAVQMENQKKL